MKLACCVLTTCIACARGATPTPEATTTGAEVGTATEEPTPAVGAVVWHTVDRITDSERYVILGRVDAPDSEGRPLDSEDVDLFLHETAAEVPPLTLVGYEATCQPVTTRRVVIVRRIDPQDPYDEAFDAVAVTSECDPVLAIEGVHLDARLVPLEISDPPFGEPILAAGESWTVHMQYGPSEDSICPGFPLHVEVRSGEQVVLTREMDVLVSHVRLAVLGERAWLVVGMLEEERVFEIGGDGEERLTWPTGIDLAQTC